MSEDKVTFTKKYRCPRHGDQGPLIGVKVSLDFVPEKNQPAAFSKGGVQICMVCWVEHLLKDCCELEEVAGD